MEVDDALDALDAALDGLPVEEHASAAAAAFAAIALPSLHLDEDELSAAARRGILVAAAGGSPVQNIGPGSPAALETAADLADLGAGPRIAAAITALADVAVDAPLAQAACRAVGADEALALDGLAVAVLAAALAGDA